MEDPFEKPLSTGDEHLRWPLADVAPEMLEVSVVASADEAIRAPGAHVATTFAREQERAMAGAVAGAKRSVAARMPPLLNTHSPFTRASTFGDAKDLYHHPPTNRIGANYTPSAGPGYKQRPAKRAKVPNDEGWVSSDVLVKRTLPKYPDVAEPRTTRGERVDDAAARTTRVRPMEPGFTRERPPSPDNPFRTIAGSGSEIFGAENSSSDDETKPRAARQRPPPDQNARRALTDAIVRYHYYVEHGVRADANDQTQLAAPPKREWFENVAAMTPTDPDPNGSLSVERFESHLASLLNEMRDDYYHAMRKSIVDYVLTNANERERLGLEVLTRFKNAKPPSPAGPPHGDLPATWRADVDAAREDIAWTLQTLSPQMTRLSDLWHEEFANARLADASGDAFNSDLSDKKVSQPWELDAFVAHQRATRETTKTALWERWTADTAEVFRDDPPVCVNADSDAYYAAVAAAQSNRLRELVARNLQALVAAVATEHTYPDECGECDPLDERLLWSNRPMFAVRLQPSGATAEFSPPLEAFEDAVTSALDGAVLATIGIPRPGASNVAKDIAVIDTFRLDDPIVVDARSRLAAAARRGRAGPESLKSIFHPHESLLSLDVAEHVREFAANVVPPKDPSGKSGEPTVLDQFRGEIDRFRATATKIRRCSGRRVRTGIYVVDCSSLKKRLADVADACADGLLDHIRLTVADTARDMNKTYLEMNERVHVKPTNVNEAVQLKKYVKETQPQMTKDIEAEIKAQKKRELFLEEYFWSTTDEDFDEICTSYGWPARMYEIMKLASRACNAEHRLWEEKLKTQRVEFQEKLDGYKAQIESFERDGDVDKREEVYTGKVEVLVKALEEAAAEAEEINDQEILFGWGITRYTEVTKLNKKFEPFKRLWTMTWETFKNHREWMQGPFSKLNSEVIDENVSDAVRAMAKLVKSFSGKGGGELMPKPLAVAEATAEKLEKFKDMLPMVHAVCNPGLRTRHWEKMTEIIAIPNFELKKDEFTSLQRLIDKGVKEHTAKLAEVSDVASREYTMEKALDKMVADWEGLDLRFKPWKETGTSILDGACVDEVQAVLDDQIVKVTAMGASPFAKPFADRVGPWGIRLDRLQSIVDQWLKCQAKWLYLEPIFSSDEIGKQIPTEAAAFNTMDTTWRRIMDVVQAAPKAVDAPNVENLLEDLEESNRQLDIVEKGLNDFLDTKKMAFPRFFFLSNDELLEILSEGKDPLRVQPFMKKCFEAVQKVEFTEQITMKTIVSVEGESVPLCKEIDPAETGAVEKWMLEFEDVMKDSLLKVTREAVVSYTEKPREEWILDWPGQVVIGASQVHWTEEVTNAIVERGLKAYGDKSNTQLTNIVNMVRGELTKLERATISALVTIDVHARDVVVQMSQDGVHDPKDFKWLAQLRYFWEDDTLKVRMINAEAQYGFEYLGNSSRLVITPLTDRCYRTLMGAIHLNLGGAPAGPAGTGKTETTKDLSKAIAIQCVVFNCSDGLDYKAMGKFFKGLAASGAWACFDEFNRIELEVLSVVAQQVLCIQRAVAAKLDRFIFEGVELRIIHTANVFITMNPGYAGRSELPDNLKALFRTVAMMVPDYAMIGEIILYSFGYLEARDCATKIVQCYKLCSEQLSSQDHYDYGMRAVMAVLRAAGNLKRRFPDEDEHVLMLRSIIDVNLCKFLSQDVPLFEGIISDLFPGVVLPKSDYTLMEKAMREACAEMNLQEDPYFFLKTTQLYEMIVVRHGLMLVGAPFSGKTMSYRVLARALSIMAERGEEGQVKCEYHCVNPKSITMGQLYGQNDPQTHEWQDGVLAKVYKGCASDPSPNRKWVMLDGPVDAIWIENMNTVLDDNKKLCLNSGEIVAMSSVMNMIFEVNDLAVASPATVSRCGMVYLEPHQLGWRPLCLSWLNTFPETIKQSFKDRVLALFDWLVPVSIRFMKREIKEVAETTYEGTNVAVNLMRTFKSLLVEQLADPKGLIASIKRPSDMEKHIDSCFVFCLAWSIGGTANSNEGRLAFDEFVRVAYKGELDLPHGDNTVYQGPSGEKYNLPEDIPEGHMTTSTPLPPDEVKTKDPEGNLIPTRTTIYDFRWDVTKSEWVPWENDIDKSPIPPEMAFKQIIVPTVDTVRYLFLADLSIQYNNPILFCGPTGTGKSVYMQGHLMGMDKEKWAPPNFVGFSAKTSSNITQYLIDAKLDKRRKGYYGPPIGKRMAIMVDDLNMPQKEVYGAQPPIELLRQYMDHGGWYDRENNFRNMQDCLFVAAMGPPGGGRSPITQRYQRHYNLLSIVEFDSKALEHIFGTILAWFYKTKEFPKDIQKLQKSIIAATLDVYNTSISKLLPTPAKSHYTFNLRDVSRVVEGLTLQKAEGIKTGLGGVGEHYRLWVHETLRVFYDRLVDDEDRSWFLEYIKELTETHFGQNFNELFAHLDMDGDGTVDAEELRHCMFGDFMGDDEPDSQGGDRLYDEITDMKEVVTRLEEYLVDYNGMSKSPMNLAMFLYAAEHVARIARVLKQPGAHLLAVGVGGSGRQSLSRLAAFIMGMESFQIAISKSYTTVEWKEDLKKFCRAAGAEGRPCVFLFSDSQIKDESYVEDINNLLNSGEVPNLFPYDERAAVMEQCRVRAKKAGQILESAEELWHYFIASCKANLHIILCFSPIGEAFRERLRQFPSLVNCCTIDWFREWPNDALEAVASKILADVDVPAEERQKLLVMCKSFHKGVGELSEEYLAKEGRHNYVTPTSYLELLNMFTSLLTKQREAVSSAKRRYEVGLEKLAFTADAVRDMQDELTALKPNLIKTVAETEELMEKVQREKVEVVEPKKAAVDEEVAEAAKKGEAAGAVKKECEDLLAEAIPALEAAVAALDTITDKDIKYVNSFKSPPAMIKLVLESVCVALAVKPAKVPDPAGTGKMIEDYWPPSKKLLMDPTFIDQLRGYDKDNIDPVIMEKLRTKYIADETYSIEKAEKAAAAAAGLCKWVFAMDSYDRVAKIVAPKQLALAEAEAEYQKIMDALKEKQDNLADIMGKLAAMEQQLEDSVNEKKRLEDEVDLCTVKLGRAESLIGGLGGEGERWKESAAKLGIAYENLTGDMLIAAGMISYLGTFTMAFRDGIADSWVSMCKESGIPSSPKFSLQDILGDPVAIRKWGIAGLPNDSFSIDNGIMIANARRWPLMIDPQGQANKWIKNMERENNVQVIKLTDGDYLRTLENAIQFGLPVLLENVKEELDPSLEPLLLKQLFKSGGVMCIKLGESIIEFSDNFRFYVTTSLRNPHYLPETAVKVTLLNFMITLDGLSDQLLGVVVAEERPDLEAQRQKLVVESADNKKRLKDIEDRILHTLSSSEGNILDDTAGIETLKEAKIVSDEITEKQIVAEATQVEIDAAREGYKPCGAYNSVLFFTIRDLANIDPMYQYSLAWFISLFVRSIHASAEESEDEDSGEPAEVDLDERLKIIAEHFTYSLYQNVCRSLFEKDKLLFSFLLCTRIMTSEGRLPVEEFNFFLTGGVGITAKSVPQPKGEEWISAKMWGEVTRLASTCSAFENLPDHIAQDTAAWKAIYDAVQPQEMTYPGEYGTQPTAFQKLLVMRCLRPDKVIPAVNDFVDATMGRRFIEPPPFDLQGSYNESNAMTPLLFILSAGSDPTAALLKFADEAGKGSDIGVISMGQGQGPKAAVLIEEGRETGKWVLLQNCHLAPSWMPSLEKICEGINAENTDEQFRLWLTSMPSPAFPVSILQNGVKMTNEPPRGLRANMRRSFQLEPIADEEFFEGCNKPEVFKKLCFGLAFCHGFVQERRSFGPIGWNIPYGFDDGDLKISVRQLQMYINENEQTPFEALKYATGECNYGGRVTDDKDRRLLNTLLRKVYAPAALKKGFRLSESGTYVIPEEGSHESYLDYIATLPILPLPEAFGLHENADITKDLGQTALLTETLIKTGGGSGGGGGAQDELVAKITKDIIDRLPPNFDIEAVQRKFPVRYEESMNTVLAQEMLRYNRLLSIIRNSLLQLQKAIAGLSVMSAELEKVFNSFAIGQVPAMWMGKSFPSLKPLGSYIEDLLARLDLFDGWYRNGQPSIFWISGFFFTPSFTTAALQNFARGNNYAIDTVGFEMEMMEMDPGLYTEPPDSGIYIHGLFMEGCAWDKDKKMLCESRPKVLFEPGPCIHLKPVLLSDIKDYPHYSCPVYRTAERRGVLATTGHSTNFLMMMKMPTDVDPDHWAMRGVAMLCSLND